MDRRQLAVLFKGLGDAMSQYGMMQHLEQKKKAEKVAEDQSDLNLYKAKIDYSNQAEAKTKQAQHLENLSTPKYLFENYSDFPDALPPETPNRPVVLTALNNYRKSKDAGKPTDYVDRLSQKYLNGEKLTPDQEHVARINLKLDPGAAQPKDLSPSELLTAGGLAAINSLPANDPRVLQAYLGAVGVKANSKEPTLAEDLHSFYQTYRKNHAGEDFDPLQFEQEWTQYRTVADKILGRTGTQPGPQGSSQQTSSGPSSSQRPVAQQGAPTLTFPTTGHPGIDAYNQVIIGTQNQLQEQGIAPADAKSIGPMDRRSLVTDQILAQPVSTTRTSLTNVSPRSVRVTDTTYSYARQLRGFDQMDQSKQQELLQRLALEGIH